MWTRENPQESAYFCIVLRGQDPQKRPHGRDAFWLRCLYERRRPKLPLANQREPGDGAPVTEEVTVTIRSLSRIRERVERLNVDASREGCQVCWEHEAQTRFLWVEHEVEREEPPESTTCAACGRIYALSYVTIGWMH